MRKSKILLLLLVLALALTAFVACKGNDDPVDPTPCTEHDDANGDGICDKCLTSFYVCQHADPNGEGKCIFCQEPMCITHLDATLDGKCDVCGGGYETVNVARALELCGEAGNVTEQRYYVRATVKTVSNASYGEMTIVDESGEIYVYGTYSHDGVDTFPSLESQPQRGDEVVLHCILQNYNGTKEIKNARLVGFIHKEADISEYKTVTVAEARDAAEDELLIVEGVVARVTYANGYKPSGVILVDGTSSIYVYGADVAGNAEIGNKIKVAGVKDFWILESETSNAAKFGYKGCNQISDAFILENDNGNHEFDKSWITESTVKEIMDTPTSVDITTKLFKVNALVKKVIPESGGFVNYYLFDIDGDTGSYTYTQCNGGDFAWLDEFDGKICTVYITALNAKSTAAGCSWRFIPVAVSYDNYAIADADIPAYALDYHALGQFSDSYTSNPELEVITSVSSELLGFEGVTVTYSSSDTSVLNFVTADGKTVMTLGEYGNATVTVTATYGTHSASKTVDISYVKAESFNYITVGEVLAAENDTVVTVKGIVGPSLVNQTGFYLFDGSVFIAVTTDSVTMTTVEMGQEIIVQGTKVRRVKTDDAGNPYDCFGQTHIKDGVVLANNYGSHTYTNETFVKDLTIDEFYALDKTVDYSTTAYVITAKIQVTQYNIKLTNADGSVAVNLYSSGVGQYAWLKDYNGQTVTLEIAACNWNSKAYWAACVLALVNEDGSRVYNTLNFDNN